MRQTLISLFAMFASLAALVCGTSLLGTLLSLRLSAEALNPAVIGLVLVFHSVGFVLGTRISTRLIRRVGQVRAFAAFAAIGCAVSLVHPMFVWAPLWAVLRAATGFCMAGMVMILESWISGRATNRNRGTLLGIYQLVYFSFAAVGQYLIGVTDPNAYPVFSLAAILVVVALVPLALTREEAPILGVAGRLPLRVLNKASPSALAGAAVAGMVSSGFLALAPLYAHRTGMPVDVLSRYLALAVLGAMLLQWPLGYLSDLFDRRRVLAAQAAVMGLGALCLAAFGGQSYWLLFGLTIPVFGITGCLYPVCLAMLNERMEQPDPVAASASLLFIFGIGTCLGPVLASGAMLVLGPSALFLFISLCGVLLATLVSYRLRTSAGVPTDQQVRFVNVPAVEAAPAIIELDPRIEPDSTRPRPSAAGV